MNFQTVEQANGNKVMMFGTFVEIGGVQYTPQQKAKAICKIADDNGVSHNVHIYQGTGQLPQPAQLQQRHSFSLSTFQGNYQGKPYTGYSGFWQSNAQVNQTAQQAPQQPAQATNHQQPAPQGKKEPDWDAKDLRIARMNALTNATTLVCLIAESNKEYTENPTEDPTLLNLIRKSAEVLVNYIYKGLPGSSPKEPQYQENPNKAQFCDECRNLKEECTCTLSY